MVDLGALHLVYEVRLFNRVDQPGYRERLGAFRIEITDAAGLWVPIHEHDGSRPIGGADGYPLIVKLAPPVLASGLRVMALGYTCLHLDQVQVHGVPAADTGDAAATPASTVHGSRTATELSQTGQSPSPPPPPPSLQDSESRDVPKRVAREIGRIALSELLVLAQREQVIRDDFLYVALLAPGGRYARRPPLCQDTTDALRLTQIIYAEYIERVEQAYGPTFHVALRDATVFGQGSVVSAGGALLIDSCWEFFSHGAPPPGLIELPNRHYQLDKPVTRHIDRPALLVKRPFWSNYGHWLVDGAALLAWLPAMALPADCQIIIGPQDSPKMRAIVRETLDILAPGLTVIEQPDSEVWTVAALHYVTPQHIPPLVMQPAAMAELAARMRRGQHPPNAGRRLYVAREASLGRQLVNEDQVIAACRQLGFEVVSSEQYSLSEQAAMFHSAECVIGVKGAALANVVFGSSATRLFVLSPADWPDPFFWDLAAQRGMAYGEMFGPVVEVREHQSRHGFEIDIPRLTQNLTAFCQPVERPAASAVPAVSG
jgi:capsular polysaccharide biosynthesis protein